MKSGGSLIGWIIAAAALGWVAFRGSRSHFVCPKCGTSFKPSVFAFMFTSHMMGKRRVTCPSCGYTDFMSPEPD